MAGAGSIAGGLLLIILAGIFNGKCDLNYSSLQYFINLLFTSIDFF